jgi:hypothetical protein
VFTWADVLQPLAPTGPVGVTLCANWSRPRPGGRGGERDGRIRAIAAASRFLLSRGIEQAAAWPCLCTFGPKAAQTQAGGVCCLRLAIQKSRPRETSRWCSRSEAQERSIAEQGLAFPDGFSSLATAQSGALRSMQKRPPRGSDPEFVVQSDGEGAMLRILWRPAGTASVMDMARPGARSR